MNIALSKLGGDCLKIEIRNNKHSPAPVPVVPENTPKRRRKTPLPKEQPKPDEKTNVVRFMVNTSQRSKYVCKMIRLEDHQLNRLLMVSCSFVGEETNVKVVEMLSATVAQPEVLKKPTILYQYTFREKKPLPHGHSSEELPPISKPLTEVL